LVIEDGASHFFGDCLGALVRLRIFSSSTFLASFSTKHLIKWSEGDYSKQLQLRKELI